MTFADPTSRAALVGQAVLTAGVSLAVLSLVGAPVIGVQGAAYGIGALLAAVLVMTSGPPGERLSIVMVGAAFLLVLISLTGSGLDGVRRWVSVGPISVQPAPLVLPLVAWVLAVRPAGWPMAGLVAGLALLFAAQPDPSATAALAAVVAGVVIARRRATPAEIAILIVAVGGFVWSVGRPDTLAPVDHVERIVQAGWAVQPAAGVAAAVMLALVPAPFVIRVLRRKATASQALVLALAGVWTVLVAASLTGRFPVPAVGYGASFVIGWLISLGLLVRKRAAVETRTWAVSPGRNAG